MNKKYPSLLATPSIQNILRACGNIAQKNKKHNFFTNSSISFDTKYIFVVFIRYSLIIKYNLKLFYEFFYFIRKVLNTKYMKKNIIVHICIFVFFIFVILTMHEAAHFITMVQKGIPVQEVGIGFNFGVLPQIKIQNAFSSGVNLTINPVPLGAYVAPMKGSQKMMQLSYADYAYITSAGVFVNIVFGIFCLAYADQSDKEYTLKLLGIIFVVCLSFWLNIFGTVLMPLCGIWISVIVIKGLIQDKNTIRGPIGIFTTGVPQKNTPHPLVKRLGGLSIGIALINTAFIPGIDGWAISARFLSLYWSSSLPFFYIVSEFLMYTLIVCLIFSEFGSLKSLIPKKPHNI